MVAGDVLATRETLSAAGGVWTVSQYVGCSDSSYAGVLALSVITFTLFGLGYPLYCLFVLLRPDSDNSSRTWLLAVAPLTRAVRKEWWTPLWATLGHYGRRLLLALLVGSARDFAQELPMLVCAVWLCMCMCPRVLVCALVYVYVPVRVHVCLRAACGACVHVCAVRACMLRP